MNTPLPISDIIGLLQSNGVPEEQIRQLMKDHDKGQETRFLEQYQWALSLWAEHLRDTKQRIIVTLDGRDTAGKGSNIKRVTEQLNNRRFWTTAFAGIPTDTEKFEYNWFDRYAASFPAEKRIQFYDRSWYNRAGVEAAMGFCTQEEYEWFMTHVNQFEKEQIIDQGIDFLKIYLSIGKKTQKERLKARENVRKRWKSSPVDAQAQEKWKDYTLAKEQILRHTDTEESPWIVLDSTRRFLSAVEIIKAIIGTRTEVRKMVEDDLSIDLSPNKKIRRTGAQELARMEREGQIPLDREFNFAK